MGHFSPSVGHHPEHAPAAGWGSGEARHPPCRSAQHALTHALGKRLSACSGKKMNPELSLAQFSELFNHPPGLLQRQPSVETEKHFLSRQQQKIQIRFLELRRGSVVQKVDSTPSHQPIPSYKPGGLSSSKKMFELKTIKIQI